MNNTSIVDRSLSLPVAAHNIPKTFFDVPLPICVPGLSPLLKLYRALPATTAPEDFAAIALEALGITVQVHGESLNTLPSSGPLLLTANHPFGGIEGLAVAALCARARPDLKILANRVLYSIPELRPMLIPVDVFAKAGDSAGNISGLRAALLHVEAGGALAVFPSGVVSHWDMQRRRVADPVWHSLAGRLARTAGTTVVPLYFEGRNSLLFQVAGCLHPALRTALLPREMWRMRGRSIRMYVGKAIASEVLSVLRDDEARTAHMRACCHAPARENKGAARNWRIPVAAPQERLYLLDEIAELPPQRTLAKEGSFRVFLINGKEAPHTLHEIGRLREETFRAIHEGSGKNLDLDRFDPHYLHLVLWDKDAGMVAGSYRARCFSPADAPGVQKNLYTASLFKFQQDFFERCGPCMELGRAFVTQEYQRGHAPLSALWKGIGRLATMTGTQTLFGPSSIGFAYAPESVLMLRQHLEERHFAPELAALAQGRRAPTPFSGPNMPDARGLEYKVLDRAVRNLEGGKGLPVLFKLYLQLGGRIAAFHEDHSFSTLDALLVVDLPTAPKKQLLRYMGEDSVQMLCKQTPRGYSTTRVAQELNTVMGELK